MASNFLKIKMTTLSSPVRDFGISQFSDHTYWQRDEPLAVAKLEQAFNGLLSRGRVSQTGAAVFQDDAAAPARPAHQIATQLQVMAEVGRRILDLIRFAMEDREAMPSSSSTLAFWDFLEAKKLTSIPLLTTDDAGNLVATWRASQDEMLTVKFVNRSN